MIVINFKKVILMIIIEAYVILFLGKCILISYIERRINMYFVLAIFTIISASVSLGYSIQSCASSHNINAY